MDLSFLRPIFQFLMEDYPILGCVILPLVLPTIVFCIPLLVRFIKNLKSFGENGRHDKKTYCLLAVIMSLLHIAFLLCVILTWTEVIPFVSSYLAFLGEFGWTCVFLSVLLGVVLTIVGIVLGIKFLYKGCPEESALPERLYIMGLVIVSIVSTILLLLIVPVVQTALLKIQKHFTKF